MFFYQPSKLEPIDLTSAAPPLL